MEMTSKIGKFKREDVIGKPVKKDDEIIGKIVSYDESTEIAIIEVEYQFPWTPTPTVAHQFGKIVEPE